MAKITNELIYEVLKKIQNDVADLKKGQRDLKDGQISLQEGLHSIRGDIIRQERAIASLELDVERIKTRLDIAD